MLKNNNFRSMLMDGRTITCSGKKVVISDGSIIVDGNVVQSEIGNSPTIIINGDVNMIICSGAVEVYGKSRDVVCVGSVKVHGSSRPVGCEGSVSCESVSGDIDCSGDCIVSGYVEGDIDCEGSVSCKSISGDIDCGGDIILKK